MAWAMVFKSGDHLSSISTLKAAARKATGKVGPFQDNRRERLWRQYYDRYITGSLEEVGDVWPVLLEGEDEDWQDRHYFIINICGLDLEQEENFDHQDRHCVLTNMLNWTDYDCTKRYIVARLGDLSGAEALPDLIALKEMNHPDERFERAIDYAINNIQYRLNDAVVSEG